MPRYVDHEARREKISAVATKLLAESGMRGVSFRSIADQLGGSTAVVTHYYETVKELIDDVAVRLASSWDEELRGLEAGIDDPADRLWALLVWLLPLTERSRREERARIALLADQLAGQEHRRVFEANEQRIRRYLRGHLSELLVDKEDVEQATELLRVVANGIVLSACEHPSAWPRRRQLSVLGLALSGLGLPSQSAVKPVGRAPRAARQRSQPADRDARPALAGRLVHAKGR